MTQFAYVGSELEIFEKAVRWKRYWSRQIAPYIRGDVLEAGAGIGANLRVFAGLNFRSWTCLEPDRNLLDQLRAALPDAARYEAIAGTLEDLPGRRFDAILYIDVLEHIEDDRGELARVVRHLEPGGALIVLAPAHQWLFSPFDAAIGHHRRYTRAGLLALAPQGVTLARARYLDSVGLAASLGNRLALRQAAPTPAQIRLWDRAMVRVSRWADPVVGYHLGKSVLVVWRRSRDGVT